MLDKIYKTLVVPVVARAIHPVIVHYLENYTDLADEPADSGKPGYDPRGTIAGTAEVAANRDHDVLEVFSFGFGKQAARGQPS